MALGSIGVPKEEFDRADGVVVSLFGRQILTKLGESLLGLYEYKRSGAVSFPGVSSSPAVVFFDLSLSTLGPFLVLGKSTL